MGWGYCVKKLNNVFVALRTAEMMFFLVAEVVEVEQAAI